ncbi:MAG: hypothetical protein RR980_05120, partial [Mucinivorans sp.]
LTALLDTSLFLTALLDASFFLTGYSLAQAKPSQARHKPHHLHSIKTKNSSPRNAIPQDRKTQKAAPRIKINKS